MVLVAVRQNAGVAADGRLIIQLHIQAQRPFSSHQQVRIGVGHLYEEVARGSLVADAAMHAQRERACQPHEIVIGAASGLRHGRKQVALDLVKPAAQQLGHGQEMPGPHVARRIRRQFLQNNLGL